MLCGWAGPASNSPTSVMHARYAQLMRRPYSFEMKRIIFYFLLFLTNSLHAQDVRILHISQTVIGFGNDSTNIYLKELTITKDSVFIITQHNKNIIKQRLLLSNEDPFLRELLYTITDKWENIEYAGKNCNYCDTRYGSIRVSLRIANTQREYLLKCTSYPINLRLTTDKIFALFKKGN